MLLVENSLLRLNISVRIVLEGRDTPVTSAGVRVDGMAPAAAAMHIASNYVHAVGLQRCRSEEHAGQSKPGHAGGAGGAPPGARRRTAIPGQRATGARLAQDSRPVVQSRPRRGAYRRLLLAWLSGALQDAVDEPRLLGGPYVAAFEKIYPAVERNDIRHIFVDGDLACAVYDFITPTSVGAVLSMELLRIGDGLIRSSELLFDLRNWPQVMAEVAARS